MVTMRAKLQITSIQHHDDGAETLNFNAVYKPDYDADGRDEDNTFALFTPSASLQMTVNNPALAGRFNVGEKFYVDFTEVPEEASAA